MADPSAATMSISLRIKVSPRTQRLPPPGLSDSEIIQLYLWDVSHSRDSPSNWGQDREQWSLLSLRWKNWAPEAVLARMAEVAGRAWPCAPGAYFEAGRGFSLQTAR